MDDGTTLQVRARGDEFFNWVEDDNGFAVARGGNGRWQYAHRENDRWVPSGMKPLQRGREGLQADPPKRLRGPETAAAGQLSSGAGTTSSQPLSASGIIRLGASTTRTIPLLVLQVSFANQAATYSASTWSNAVFGAAGRTVNTFYREASNERFHFTQPNETQGITNDGVISVTLSSTHPNTTAWLDTLRIAVTNALTAANPYINYQSYDTDGNGTLDNTELQLILIFSGYEAAYGDPLTPYVWAHQWSLYGTVPAPQLDGVRVGEWPAGYTVIGEIHRLGSANHAATIGVMCHELGHNLGWPDLYDTDGSSDGIGFHCLMSYGNWGRAREDSYSGQTPVLPCAFLRQMLGFSDVRDAMGYGLDYSLTQVSDKSSSNDIVRLTTSISNQYFLVENRQETGFDSGLYSEFGVTNRGGLAVWHIDESMADNATDSHRLVDLEEAGSASLDVAGGNRGNVTNYFYSGNKTLFNATTTPNSKLYSGADSLVAISNVSASAAQMTFRASAGAIPLARMEYAAQSLSFPWQGGSAQIRFYNTGTTPLVWQTASAAWCSATPSSGTLAIGVTQLVSVACATNTVRQVARSGSLSVSAAGTNGISAVGSPYTVPLSQAARPADPVTIFSLR